MTWERAFWEKPLRLPQAASPLYNQEHEALGKKGDVRGPRQA